MASGVHTAEVLARSRYEAAALGVAEFKRCGLMGTQRPATRHKLTMAKLESWIAGGAKSPR